MSIYNGYTANIRLTAEDEAVIFEAFKDSLLEEFIEDEIEDDEEELVEEGANIDYIKTFRLGKKEYRLHYKAAKKAVRAKDFKEAKKEFELAKKALQKCKRDIEKIDSTVFSNSISIILTIMLQILIVTVSFVVAIGGIDQMSKGMDKLFFASNFKFTKENITAGLAKFFLKGALQTAGGVVTEFLGIFSATYTLMMSVFQDIKFFKDAKNKVGQDKLDNLNMIRAKILNSLDTTVKTITALEKNCDDAEKLLKKKEK